MEIREYLKVVQRRLWIPIALPLCAALIVVAATLLGPQEYAVTATVTAGAFTSGDASQYTGPNADRAFVEDFIAALETQTVVAKIAEASKVPPSAIIQGLRVSSIGDGGLVQVVYQSVQPAQAQQVAHQAVREAIALLFGPPRAFAQAQIEGAQHAIAVVDAEIDRFVAASGLVRPDVVYERKAEQLADLQAQAAQDPRTTRFSNAIAAQRAELAILAPQVRAFTALQDRRDEAVERLTAATRALAQVDALLQTVDTGRIITVGAPTPIAKAPIALRRGAAAIGSGVFLGVALVVLVESLGHGGLASMMTLATNGVAPSVPVAQKKPAKRARAGVKAG